MARKQTLCQAVKRPTSHLLTTVHHVKLSSCGKNPEEQQVKAGPTWGTLKPAVTDVLSDWKETAETQTVHVSSEVASSSAVVPVCSGSGRTGMLERSCYLSESPFFMLGYSYS